jgi:hypothetical protein
MDTRKSSSESKGHTSLQTKEQQQVKKANLASALRDNLRRRKAVASSSPEAEDEDSSL